MSYLTNINALNDLITAQNANKVFFLVDENTHEHCLPNLLANLPGLGEYEILEVEPGEETKSLDIAANLWLSLAELEASRKDLMVNVGGGMITDLGAFIASTYKRGMPFINVPTSLLAMVDAAHGGKTGVDLANVKNLVGTFADAKGVFMQAEFLETLPEREKRSGFAEVLKHGLIADAKHWLSAIGGFPNVTDELINASAQIKLDIVAQDPQEAGLRKILNFGHTLGHALESYLLQKGKPILHGEAIAAGMIMEAELSMRYCDMPLDEYEEIKQNIDNFFSRIPLKRKEIKTILEFLKFDKKNEGGKCQFSLLKNIGQALINIEVEVDDAEKALLSYSR